MFRKKTKEQEKKEEKKNERKEKEVKKNAKLEEKEKDKKKKIEKEKEMKLKKPWIDVIKNYSETLKVECKKINIDDDVPKKDKKDGAYGYRYSLTISWNAQIPPLLVIGCNPSVATKYETDRTMKKVVYIAMNNGYGGVIMCNLFAYKEKEPEHMKDAARKKLEKENVDVAFKHICGIENDVKIIDAANSVEDVVFAYGQIAVTGWKDAKAAKDGTNETSDFNRMYGENGKKCVCFQTHCREYSSTSSRSRPGNQNGRMEKI